MRLHVKKVLSSFRCHNNSNVNEILIFIFYIIQLGQPFLQIFVNGDVINALTQEVLPLKNPIAAT